jgi:hypothetical protein
MSARLRDRNPRRLSLPLATPDDFLSAIATRDDFVSARGDSEVDHVAAVVKLDRVIAVVSAECEVDSGDASLELSFGVIDLFFEVVALDGDRARATIGAGATRAAKRERCSRAKVEHVLFCSRAPADA